MEKLQDILLDGEAVIWQGAPDSQQLNGLKFYSKQNLQHIFWMTLTTIIAVSFLWASSKFNLSSTAAISVGIICAGLLFMAAIMLMGFLSPENNYREILYDNYVLTNKRLIVENNKKKSRRQLFDLSRYAIVNDQEVRPHRLIIYFGDAEEAFVTLLGLKDTDYVENLIVKTLMKE